MTTIDSPIRVEELVRRNIQFLMLSDAGDKTTVPTNIEIHLAGIEIVTRSGHHPQVLANFAAKLTVLICSFFALVRATIFAQSAKALPIM